MCYCGGSRTTALLCCNGRNRVCAWAISVDRCCDLSLMMLTFEDEILTWGPHIRLLASENEAKRTINRFLENADLGISTP